MGLHAIEDGAVDQFKLAAGDSDQTVETRRLAFALFLKADNDGHAIYPPSLA
jgi:hypothetical protein